MSQRSRSPLPPYHHPGGGDEDEFTGSASDQLRVGNLEIQMPSHARQPQPGGASVHALDMDMHELPIRLGRRPSTLGRGSNRALPIKTALAAGGLFSLGVLLLIGSVVLWSKGLPGAMPFLILGLIVLCPGAYASVQLYGAYQRWPGYDFSQLPSYDNI